MTETDMSESPKRRRMRWWMPATILALGAGTAAYFRAREVPFIEPILIGIALLTVLGAAEAYLAHETPAAAGRIAQGGRRTYARRQATGETDAGLSDPRGTKMRRRATYRRAADLPLRSISGSGPSSAPADQ